MALSPGTRLGHYDVTALIGQGGMGQVWQATDTQLNRQVAIKFLTPDLTRDETAKQRLANGLSRSRCAGRLGLDVLTCPRWGRGCRVWNSGRLPRFRNHFSVRLTRTSYEETTASVSNEEWVLL